MRMRHCTSPTHVGDRLVSGLDLYAIRIERRRLSTLSDRRFREIESPVCVTCADRWFSRPTGIIQEELAL